MNGVSSGYAHHSKQCVSEGIVKAGSARLKWYALHRADAPVAAALTGQARRCVSEWLGAAGEPGDLGYVILHRCGEDFYFLLVQVWRGSNELWEAVHYSSAGSAFAPFDPAYPPPGAYRPTFCVWELAAVGHEMAAWTRFLRSARSESDAQSYLDDRLSGAV